MSFPQACNIPHSFNEHSLNPEYWTWPKFPLAIAEIPSLVNKEAGKGLPGQTAFLTGKKSDEIKDPKAIRVSGGQVWPLPFTGEKMILEQERTWPKMHSAEIVMLKEEPEAPT